MRKAHCWWYGLFATAIWRRYRVGALCVPRSILVEQLKDAGVRAGAGHDSFPARNVYARAYRSRFTSQKPNRICKRTVRFPAPELPRHPKPADALDCPNNSEVKFPIGAAGLVVLKRFRTEMENVRL